MGNLIWLYEVLQDLKDVMNNTLPIYIYYIYQAWGDAKCNCVALKYITCFNIMLVMCNVTNLALQVMIMYK